MADMSPNITVWNWLALAGLLALNAFFVAAEYAMVRVRKTRLEELARRGAGGAKQALTIVGNLDRYIATTQLGITMAGIALGWVGEPALSSVLGSWLAWPLHALDEGARRAISAIVSLLCVTFVTVVVSELLPKSLSIQFTEPILLTVSPVVVFMGAVFAPVIGLLNVSANGLLRLLGVRPAPASEGVYTVEELKLMVQASEESGVLEDSEREMLHAVFDLGDLTAHDLMVPRTEIVAVPADTPLPDLVNLCLQYPHSRFPVYEADLDHIVGIVHAKDLVRAQAAPSASLTARALMRETLFVPDTLNVNQLLQQLRTKRQHLAIVLDEYGGTAGLVTLKDLIERIVGEVNDSFDPASLPQIQRRPDGAALIDGLTNIETVNAALGLTLSDPYYNTLGGLLMGRLGRMAKVGDVVDVDGLQFRVDGIDGLRIARITLLKKPAP